MHIKTVIFLSPCLNLLKLQITNSSSEEFCKTLLKNFTKGKQFAGKTFGNAEGLTVRQSIYHETQALKVMNGLCGYGSKFNMRYLGQFLEEKLTLDQLTVDLYKGIGVISDVALDVQALNDVAEQQNIPFEFTDGFIEKMSVSVPWSSILSNATNIQVEGLSLTIKKTERDKARVSMFESMWSSMTSSMQLAEDCLKSEREGGSSSDENSTFEGIESFAHTIDSILSRIKVKFIRTVIRLEEIASNYKIGVAFEINVKLIEYFDEAAAEAEEAQHDFHLPAFSTKKIYLDGVTFFSDEFPVSTMADSKSTFPVESDAPSERSQGTNNVLVARFAGRQEVTMRFKQEGVEGPKIDLQISLGALTAFLSPRQAHSLLVILNGVTSSKGPRGGKSHCVQKPMEESDFRKIEQELQMNMNQGAVLQPKGLRNQTWANTCLDGSEYEFAPLHNSSRLNDSVISSSSSLISSVMSMSSRSSHCPVQSSFLQPKRKIHSGIAESDSNAVVFHFHILLSSLSVVLLHEDILTVSADGAPVTVSKTSFEEMRRLAEKFFEGLGLYAASGYGNKDFEKAREVFSAVCQLNHIRYMAAPIIVEGSETSTSHTSVIKGKLTASSMELIECLLEKETHSQKLKVEYVELLKFNSSCSERKDSHQFLSRPNLTLNFRLTQTNSHNERGRTCVHPKSTFSFELQPFEAEIDITIIDRISALLKADLRAPKKCTFNLSSSSADPLVGGHVQQVVDHNTTPNLKQDIKINSSFATFKVRFPVPDLRPMHDMDKAPWWKRSVRKDILYLNVTEFILHTVVDDLETVSKYEIQFKDVVAKFKEADADSPVELAKASAAQNCAPVMDGGRGFGWPRLVVHLYPKTSAINLEESELSANCLKTSHNLGYQSVVSNLENTTKKEHSPFSCKKIIHESDTPHEKASGPEQDGEELIIPGDNAEISDFIEVASLNTRIKLDVTLPTASVTLPSKHLYEVLYNRISSDLLLWEPSAPVHDNHSMDPTFDFEHSPTDFLPTFSLCKSAVLYESDSDSETSEGVFYSVHEQKQRHKKKQLVENNKMMGQSKVVMHLSVLEGVCDVYAPVRDSQGNVIPRQHGELHLSFEEGTLFLVSGYKGKSDLDYLCVQVNHFSFYHNGLVSDSAEKPPLRSVACRLPPYLELTLRKTDKCALVDQSTSVGVGSCRSLDMLTVSVRVQKNHLTEGLKTFRVAVGIREATLRHKVCTGQSSWFTQLIDFFDVTDYPIPGYEPSSILSEINVHLWNCAVDYRPLHLPLRCVLTVGNLNISSNIAAQTSSSTLRFIAEEAAFFLSNRTGGHSEECEPDLRRDYVCVMELGLFELSLRLSDRNEVNPKVDLRASANVAHLWTCSDSAKALTELLMYFASDGDLAPNEGAANEGERPKGEKGTETEEQLLVRTGDNDSIEGLSKSQVALVNDLMEEAMKESKVVESKEGPGKIIYYQSNEDEGEERQGEEEEEDERCLGVASEVNGFHGEDKDVSWEEEFCIVQDEAGLGMLPKKGLPEVRNLTSMPIRLVDNHFSMPLGKADLLRSPKHYPKPVLRYMLREMSLVWHMYGGSDFEEDPQAVRRRCKIKQSPGASSEASSGSEPVVTFCKDSPSGVGIRSKNIGSMNWKRRGGVCRRHDILMELQLNKVRFQHEVYPEHTAEASRQVLLIQELELRDRLATSTINKFLYQYSSEAKPKQSQAPMVVVKSVLMRSDPKINAQECCLKVSLLPLRLNIDQDSVLFLYRFFGDLAGDIREEEEDCSSRAHTPKHQVPVMTVNVGGKSDSSQPEPQPLLIDLEGENAGKATASIKNKKKTYVPKSRPPPQPLFFRCFIFSPEVPVKLDYQGKRVDMTHGSLAGILMGLGQLNNSELRLRKISYRHGLLGFDRLMNFVLSEWANDIKKNQLPSLLGGVGPMHSLVQLIQGIRDLFWLPIEQYQKDGRLVRGFQRGANSFTTSTAMASLEIISRLIHIIQTTAETAYDMVSPGPSVRSCKRKGKGKCKRYTQPADIREGMAIAYLVVKEGIGETAETIVRVASEEHEQKGVTGAVGGVLRQIPPTVVKPIILATEATNNVIGGMRSQLVPDARKEAVEKWRRQDF